MARSDDACGKQSLLAAIAALCLATACVAEPVAVEVTSASAGHDKPSGRPALLISLAESSKQAMHYLSTNNIARKLELRIDGKPVLTSIIREPLGTSIKITADDLPIEKINELVDRLSKHGTRVEVEIVSE